MYIHTDKLKTKAKEAEERQRQEAGGTPEPNRVTPRFLEGMTDPEAVVCTTHSGSMTQETFKFYVDHFIDGLPQNHGPMILLLDGHGSQWNVPALEKLMENKMPTTLYLEWYGDEIVNKLKQKKSSGHQTWIFVLNNTNTL